MPYDMFGEMKRVGDAAKAADPQAKVAFDDTRLISEHDDTQNLIGILARGLDQMGGEVERIQRSVDDLNQKFGLVITLLSKQS